MMITEMITRIARTVQINRINRRHSAIKPSGLSSQWGRQKYDSIGRAEESNRGTRWYWPWPHSYRTEGWNYCTSTIVLVGGADGNVAVAAAEAVQGATPAAAAGIAAETLGYCQTDLYWVHCYC